jgi:D-amino peptidase
MKVFVSVDMEGVSGVTDPEDVLPVGAEYQKSREFMTGDANAAVAGAFDGGAAHVVVNDSHWTQRNLLVDRLDRRALHVKGLSKPMCMLQGLDESYAAALLVGYHSCAGTEGGVLNHTFLGKEVMNVYVNGQLAGETRINAALAGEIGVPVALVTGDEAVCEEARRLLGDDIVTVAVKEGIDRTSAVMKHPAAAQEEIQEAAAQALARVERIRPYVIQPPITLAFDWGMTSTAMNVALIPGVVRSGPRSTEYTADSMSAAMRMIWVWCLIAMQVGQHTGIQPGTLVYG